MRRHLSILALILVLLGLGAVPTNATSSRIEVIQWSVLETFPTFPDYAGEYDANLQPIVLSEGSALQWGVEILNPQRRAGRQVLIRISGNGQGASFTISQLIDTVPPGRSIWGYPDGLWQKLKSCDYKKLSVTVSQPKSYEPYEKAVSAKVTFEYEDGSYSPTAVGVVGVSSAATVWLAQTFDGRIRAATTFAVPAGSEPFDGGGGLPGFPSNGVVVGAAPGTSSVPVVSERVRRVADCYLGWGVWTHWARGEGTKRGPGEDPEQLR